MRIIILVLAILALAACDRQNGASSQANDSAAEPASPTGGLDRSQAGKPAPAVQFKDPEGDLATLADFRGKPLLLNLWATWCAPCVKELPTLDALSNREGAPQVLALSQDMADQAKVAEFLGGRKIGLEPFQDAEMAISSALGMSILPTTVLYDANGREVWRYSGDMDWTGAEAAKLLAEGR
ncbi:MAG TPA: TlpA disulfide reductase family protein [Sphingomicrobium sp.]|jgi:thiol-disulfide isomerase/thioredoxin|nr:TlpA disulfide reductase family protein [Sphingomicrobium sp.]